MIIRKSSGGGGTPGDIALATGKTIVGIAGVGAAVYPRPLTKLANGATTLTTTENSGILTNEGATLEVVPTLPTAATGLEFAFCVQAALNIKITPSALNTIRLGADVSGIGTAGYVQCAVVGSWITLKAINTTEWVAIGYWGPWTIL